MNQNHSGVAARLAAALCLATGWLAPARGAVLPKFAFSLPAEVSPSEAVRALQACGFKDKLMVLPPLSWRLAGPEAAAAPGASAQALGELSEEAEVFLRVKVLAGELSGAAREQEKIVSERVGELMQRLPLGAPAVKGLVIEVEPPAPASELLQFTLANLALKAKGFKTGLRVFFFFPAGFSGELGELIGRLATYADGLGTSYGPGWREQMSWVAEHALNRPLLLRLETAGRARPEELTSAYLDAAMAASGTSVETLWIEASAAAAVSRVCAVRDFLARFLTPDFTPAEMTGLPFSLAVEGRPGAELRAFAGGRKLDLGVLVKAAGSPQQPRSVTLTGPPREALELACYDPSDGRSLPVSEARKTERAITRQCASDAEFAFLFLRRTAASEEAAYTALEVTARADLKVEEVIARFQQYQESQRRLLDNFTASCLLNLHFESAGMGSGFDVAMQFQQFYNRSGLSEWVQTGFFVNGVRFKRGREFPLPQLEPEKVVTQPLELQLGEKYSYRLLGVDQVDGVFCYVVGVEPKLADEALYTGKIWIDGTTFRRVRMQVNQRSAKSNVISNMETQEFALVSDDKGNQCNLLRSIYAQQTLNAAGRTFLLEKRYRFSDYALNGAGFDAALEAARLSDNPMYRDTEQGLRALRKEGNQRVVEPAQQKRMRSFVSGVLYEGSLNFPIPMFGFSLVDFDYRRTGAQLSIFFAGPIVAANLSKQYSKSFRAGVDVALSGLPENNRVYVGDTERKEERLWIFEETAGVRAAWQATSSLSLTASSYLSYNRFRATGDSEGRYLLPRNGLLFQPGLEVRFARKGYLLTTSAWEGLRPGWKPFGPVSAPPEPTYSTFTKYSVEFSKNVYAGRFTRGGINVAGYGGDRLDRFSLYRPSFFSRPRVRGIPSGTDSSDTIGLASVNYGFNVMELVKLEGFYSHARARNKFESRRFQKYDGLEFDFGTAGPRGTFLQGTVTYALRGNLERYGSRWCVYFMIFKPLRK